MEGCILKEQDRRDLDFKGSYQSWSTYSNLYMREMNFHFKRI